MCKNTDSYVVKGPGSCRQKKGPMGYTEIYVVERNNFRYFIMSRLYMKL